MLIESERLGRKIIIIIFYLSSTNARYNQDQFVQCELEGPNKECCLITEYNELPNGRYFDPKTKQSFK